MTSDHPVEMRYTETGFAHNVAVALFASTAPYASGWLAGRTGNPLSPAWYLGLVACAAVVAAFALRRSGAPRSAVRPIGPLRGEALNS